jgi:hypothetical protein
MLTEGRGETMAGIAKAGGAQGRVGGARMLQVMYEAARREVFADPAAALRKYQPTWALSMPNPVTKGRHHR